MAVDHMFCIDPRSAPGYWTGDIYPNVLGRHQGDHLSNCTRMLDNEASGEGGSANVAFDLEHG